MKSLYLCVLETKPLIVLCMPTFESLGIQLFIRYFGFSFETLSTFSELWVWSMTEDSANLFPTSALVLVVSVFYFFFRSRSLVYSPILYAFDRATFNSVRHFRTSISPLYIKTLLRFLLPHSILDLDVCILKFWLILCCQRLFNCECIKSIYWIMVSAFTC